MKLISTEIDEDSVELTYADNSLLDAAETLLIVRMPLVARDNPSLARVRIDVLETALEFLRAETVRQHNILRS